MMERGALFLKKNSVGLYLNQLVLKVNKFTERQNFAIAMTKIDKFGNEIT